jgi:xanthine dehydrogenase accessory factor
MTETNWSVPETEVLNRIGDILASDERGVLATIVHVEGSAYRRPGAKMVIPEGGVGVGHITAGCLEDEVGRLADEVLAAGEPRVETYDLRPEADDDVWGLGVGCNGVLDVLLEPIDEGYRTVVDAAREGRNVGVATVVDAPDGAGVGRRAYYHPETGTLDTEKGFPADVGDAVEEVVADLAARGKAKSIEVGDVTVFVDGIAAPDDLVVVGSGNDAGPIVEEGKRAGFRVTVLGFRGANATEERFPAADAVESTSPARITETFDFDEDTYVVVATHNFVDDRIAVDELLGTDVPYVGLMGPRKRFDEMREDFREEGREFSESELDRLYTPVGLDLGGGTPHQIALSIVGEVLAVSNDRTPQHLKDREGTIHDRVELSADGGS